MKAYFNLLTKFILSIYLCTVISACRKSTDGASIPKEDNKIVYVAGFTDSTTLTADSRRAVYWQDGQKVILPYKNFPPTQVNASIVWAMTAIGKDIYIAGTNYNHAGYWKNGVFYSLYVNDLPTVREIVNDGIYVYTTLNTGNGFLCYKNTQSLGNGGVSIAADGGKVYVLTFVNTKPFLQVDNVITSAISNELAIAERLAVSNGDVYVAGEGYNSTGGPLTVKLLKNNKLLYSATDESLIRAITISGTDIYVVGDVYVAGVPAAAIWKNGVQTIIESNAHATSIAVDGKDVYIAGSKNIAGNIYQACYWKNGIIKPLSTQISAAQAIVIVEK